MNKPAPLSQRQYEYMRRCMHSWFNVAEGGKRGGKNVLATLIFCSLLETHKNKIHLVAGVSNATAKLNMCRPRPERRLSLYPAAVKMEMKNS